MGLQDNSIDFTTLTWVKPELDETLRQARNALQSYVEEGESPAELRACSDLLHQVQGTLRMVELYGAAMVAEEMEQLGRALIEGKVEDRDAAYATLMQGIVQLPDYLERLQGGHRDIPIVLLPLLNQLRASRGEQGLNESVLFSPDLSRPLPESARGPRLPLEHAELTRRAEALRGLYQGALLRWLKDDNSAATIRDLTDVCEQLVPITSAEPARRLFWVAAGTLDALSRSAFPVSTPLKQALAKVEREIKRLADGGDAAFRQDPPIELTKQLLYFVAHEGSDTGRIGEIRQVFGLSGTEPTEAELAHARGSLSGNNRALLETVAAAIKDDLLRVKDALDLHLRTPNARAADLGVQVESLDRVADTLGMLGLSVPRRVVQDQRSAINDVVSGLRRDDEATLLDIAGALLYVEAALDDQVERLGKDERIEGEASASNEQRRLLEVLVKEAIVNFSQARQCFVAFVETHWDHAQLNEVPRLLTEVAGALRILNVPAPADYLVGVRQFTENELLFRKQVPTGHQMDRLADTLASLEYFLEALRDRRPNREQILEVARQSLAGLGYWPLRTDALAGPSAGARAPARPVAPTPAAAAPAPAPVPTPDVVEAEKAWAPDTAAAFDAATTAAPAAAPVHAAVPDSADASAGMAHSLAVGAPIPGFDAAGSEEIDDEIREVFLEEFEEEIDNLAQLLPTWRDAPDDAETLRPIRRVFHTLKGSGRLVGAKGLGEFSWKIESLLNRVLDGSRPASPQVLALVQLAFEHLPLLRAALQGASVSADLEGIQAAADLMATGEEITYAPSLAATDDIAAIDLPSEPEPARGESVADADAGEGPVFSIDPVLFEILKPEVGGHLETVDAWLAECAARGPQPVNDRLLRAIHTMNGAFAMTEVSVITEVTAPLEGFVKRALAHQMTPSAEGVALVADAARAIRETVLAIERPQPVLPHFGALSARAYALRDSLPDSTMPSVPVHLDDEITSVMPQVVVMEAADLSAVPTFHDADAAAAQAAAEEAAAAEAAAAQAAAEEAAAAEAAAAQAAAEEAAAAEAAAAQAAAEEAAAAEAAAAQAAAEEAAAAEAAAAQAAAEEAAAQAAAEEAAAQAAAEEAAAQAAAEEAAAQAAAEEAAAQAATEEAAAKAAAEEAAAQAAAESAAAQAAAEEAAAQAAAEEAAAQAAAEEAAAKAAAEEAAAAEAAANVDVFAWPEESEVAALDVANFAEPASPAEMLAQGDAAAFDDAEDVDLAFAQDQDDDEGGELADEAMPAGVHAEAEPEAIDALELLDLDAEAQAMFAAEAASDSAADAVMSEPAHPEFAHEPAFATETDDAGATHVVEAVSESDLPMAAGEFSADAYDDALDVVDYAELPEDQLLSIEDFLRQASEQASEPTAPAVEAVAEAFPSDDTPFDATLADAPAFEPMPAFETLGAGPAETAFAGELEAPRAEAAYSEPTPVLPADQAFAQDTGMDTLPEPESFDLGALDADDVAIGADAPVAGSEIAALSDDALAGMISAYGDDDGDTVTAEAPVFDEALQADVAEADAAFASPAPVEAESFVFTDEFREEFAQADAGAGDIAGEVAGEPALVAVSDEYYGMSLAELEALTAPEGAAPTVAAEPVADAVAFDDADAGEAADGAPVEADGFANLPTISEVPAWASEHAAPEFDPVAEAAAAANAIPQAMADAEDPQAEAPAGEGVLAMADAMALDDHAGHDDFIDADALAASDGFHDHDAVMSDADRMIAEAEAAAAEAEAIRAAEEEEATAAAEAAAAEAAAAEAAAAEAAAAKAAAAEAAAAEAAAAEAAAAEAAAAEAAAAEAAAAEAAAAEAAAAEAAAAEAAAAEAAAARPVETAAAVQALRPKVPLALDPSDPEAELDMTDLDPELLDLFLEESNDLLDHSDGMLARLRDETSDRDAISTLQRDLHTLKGGARMAGIYAVGELGHAMESLLEAAAEGRQALDASGVVVLERGFDRLHGMVARIGERKAIALPAGLIAQVEALSQGLPLGEAEISADASADGTPAPAVARAAPQRPLSAPIDELAEDELTGVRAPQEQVRIRADLLDRLVNYAGEVAIYRARLEQQLGAFRSNLGELNQTTTRLREQLRRLDIETEAQIVARYQRQDEAQDERFDPLELDRFTNQQQLTRALNESANDLVNLQGSLDDLTRQYETLLLQQSRVSSDLQEGLMRTRMVPFDALVPRLRRVLRQAATDTGKQVQLKVDGASGEMDRNVLDRMTAPLEHMLRNAMAHGLETPDERQKARKPEEGTVRIAVHREGSEVVLKVSDDGRGLDKDAIRAKAIERGVIAADADLSDEALYALILEAGFSTAESVSRLAGRGVGMDVVYSEIRQLGGSLQIKSDRGRGSEFTIRLPFTLAVTQAVFVKIGDTSYAVPIASVQGVGRIGRDELDKQLASGSPVFQYAGEDYAIHDLGALIGHAPAKAQDSLQMPLLLARSGDLRSAISIDQVLGSREIVVKPVGPQVNSVPGIFGATIMGDGRVVVILDVAPLVRRQGAIAREQALQPPQPAPAPAPAARSVPVVMVVDDSITMRKVTGRILERNSMEVLTAKDGVDAVEKMAERVPDLVLLDIEMPRMDGYEVAQNMRSDPRLKDVPIIMITSRTGEKHRQRAMDIGVNRYLGKPYQEPELMRNVFEMLGIAMEHADV